MTQQEMADYIHKWIKVAEKSSFNTTYQLNLGKAILDAIFYFAAGVDRTERRETRILDLSFITEFLLSLYWSHRVKLNLNHGLNAKIPRIIEEFHEKLHELHGNNNLVDIGYTTMRDDIIRDNPQFFNTRYFEVLRLIKTRLIQAFNNDRGEPLDLFRLTDHQDALEFRNDHLWLLYDYYLPLKYVFDYKHLQLLSKYNDTLVVSEELFEMLDYRVAHALVI